VRAGEIRAGIYFAAQDRFGGSPALPLDRVRRAVPRTRREFDEAYFTARGIAPAPPRGRAGGASPVVERGTPAERTRSCVRADGALSLRLPASGVRVSAPAAGVATLRLRRLGDDVPEAFAARVDAGTNADLRLPGDALPEPWRMTVDGPPGTRVCGLSA